MQADPGNEGDMFRLVREAKIVVEKWDGSSPAQIKWKSDWLYKADVVGCWSGSLSRARALAELIDGVYNLVELFKPAVGIDRIWQEVWLSDARRLVPGCSSLWI